MDRILAVDMNVTYECSTLYKVDYVAKDRWANNVFHIYSPSFRGVRLLRTALRALLATFPAIPTKLVYVRRTRGIRSVEHDTYLIDRLRETYNDEFVVFEGGSFQEQAVLFSSAKMIFGPHGAGLTNMLFCPEGTTVLELQLSPNCNTCFEHMAAGIGFPYIGYRGCTSYYYVTYTPTEQDLDTLVHCIRSRFE
jgi:capsular polysaccharide biosynthesis protein